MALSITPILAALLALLLIGLSLRVINLRWRYKVGLGDGGHPALEQAIRVHANFVEYVPVALILLMMLELQGRQKPWILFSLGGVLLIGRLLHAYGLSTRRGTSAGRMIGMVLTFACIILSAILILYTRFA